MDGWERKRGRERRLLNNRKGQRGGREKKMKSKRTTQKRVYLLNSIQRTVNSTIEKNSVLPHRVDCAKSHVKRVSSLHHSDAIAWTDMPFSVCSGRTRPR